MSARRADMHQLQEALRLHRLGQSRRQIARQLQIGRDTVARYFVAFERTLAKGFGFCQSKPATAFSPVALTPDELGAAWAGGKVNLPLVSHINGQPFGKPDAGVDMIFDFPRLIAHAARTRTWRRRHHRLRHCV